MARHPKKPRKGVQLPEKHKGPGSAGIPQNIARDGFRWRVENLDWCGEWGWRLISTRELLKEIVPKLHHYEDMTWAEIEGSRGHFVPVGNFVKSAQDRLDKIGLQEDSLFALRLTGKKRIWGIRDITILRILWWDPDHKICPSLKKHT